jgi:hypothetical protein
MFKMPLKLEFYVSFLLPFYFCTVVGGGLFVNVIRYGLNWFLGRAWLIGVVAVVGDLKNVFVFV